MAVTFSEIRSAVLVEESRCFVVDHRSLAVRLSRALVCRYATDAMLLAGVLIHRHQRYIPTSTQFRGLQGVTRLAVGNDESRPDESSQNDTRSRGPASPRDETAEAP